MYIDLASDTTQNDIQFVIHHIDRFDSFELPPTAVE